jgi:DNA-binding HxlR family transcriptional regulator
VGFNFLRSGFGYWLAREPHHFSGLLRRVAPISHKVLTEQLRGLGSKGDGGS